MKKKSNLTWIVSSMLLSILFYFICSRLTKGNDATFIVGLAGVLALIISYIFKMRITTITATLGYPISYILGIVFETDSITYPGGASSNWWQIWIVSYWIFIGIGITIDIIMKYRTKKNKS